MSENQRNFHSVDAIKVVAEKLSVLDAFKDKQNIANEEAWAMANDFSDIEESCFKLIFVYLKRLVREDLNAADMETLLFDIGEEYRHLKYHMTNSSFYKYLNDDSEL